MTQHRIGAEVLQSCCATAGEGSVQTPSRKLSPSSSQEPVAQADHALQLSPPWVPCPTLEARVGRRVPSQLLPCYITWKGAGE